MEFRVLGPIGFGGPGQYREPRGRLRRRLLATLIARAGRPVSHHQLSVALWGDPDGVPPVSRLHLQVHRLRQDLGDSDLVVAADDGYLLAVDPNTIDAVRFDRRAHDALAAADTDPSRGELARQALQQWADPWHGEAYPGVDTEICLAESSRLAELRLDVAEVFVAAELSSARQLDVLSDLRSLAGEHPLRESLQVLLMRALHQAGRQQDALEVYRTTRTRLVEDLGLEPSRALREAQEAVLAGAEPGTGRPVIVPSQLPAAPDLVGRAEVLTELDAVLGAQDPASAGTPGSRVCVLTGPPGAGKTSIAVAWASSRMADFPDGQLFVDLRGFSSDAPIGADEALDGFITALGGDTSALRTTQDRTAAYRSLVAGRQILVVLDNARTADQVRPLLPGAPGSRVIITSRDSLGGLSVREQAHRLDVAGLPMDQALVVLRGDAPAADVEEARWQELARRCGRLPLLLRVAAERIRLDPGDLEFLGEADVDARTLDLLELGDPDSSARTVLSWSYQALGADAARLFDALGVLPVRTIDVATLAAMTEVDDRTARRGTDELVRAHLVRNVDGWLIMHDVVAAYARDCAGQIPEPERTVRYVRALEHWQATLIHAQQVAKRGRIDESDADAARFTSTAQALAWLQRADEPTVQLACAAPVAADHAVAGLAHADGLSLHRTLSTHLKLIERSRAAARRLGDLGLEAIAEGSLAAVKGKLGEPEACVAAFRRALTLLEQHGAEGDIVPVRNNFGTALADFGDLRGALEHYDAALDELAAHGAGPLGSVRRREGILWGNVAAALCALGRSDDSLDALERALERMTGEDDLISSASVLVTRAEVELHRGQLDEAEAIAGQAAVLRRTGRVAEAVLGEKQVARLRAECGLELSAGWDAAPAS